jgi:hypothetical protein
VAVLGVLVLVLLVLNMFGIKLIGRGYDANVGGSAADWFGALATLVALPAAVLFSVRQLQSSTEAIELERRKWDEDQAERAERRSAELAALRSAVEVKVEVANVVDTPELATPVELAAVERWRHEYGQRGWVIDPAGSSWQQGTVRRSNAELLTAESSPLVPQPWFVAMTCRNGGANALSVGHWSALVDNVTTTIDSPAELGPGESLRHRLGTEVGLAEAYVSREEADQHAAGVTVIVDGHDGVGREVRIVHPSRD